MTSRRWPAGAAASLDSQLPRRAEGIRPTYIIEASAGSHPQLASSKAKSAVGRTRARNGGARVQIGAVLAATQRGQPSDDSHAGGESPLADLGVCARRASRRSLTRCALSRKSISCAVQAAASSAPFDWSPELLADLDALRRPSRDPAILPRIGERLRQFLLPLGWAEHEQQILTACARGERVVLTIRSAAAELYALPWSCLRSKQRSAPGRAAVAAPALRVARERDRA